uniref:Uncharacterized protein n=1 Tax=Molossus molossus TaxID=27622 RepID=A0A7J8I166_MOLMO|nr:hypothetical protein HJG59_010810 [Molossus molossus]
MAKNSSLRCIVSLPSHFYSTPQIFRINCSLGRIQSPRNISHSGPARRARIACVVRTPPRGPSGLGSTLWASGEAAPPVVVLPSFLAKLLLRLLKLLPFSTSTSLRHGGRWAFSGWQLGLLSQSGLETSSPPGSSSLFRYVTEEQAEAAGLGIVWSLSGVSVHPFPLRPVGAGPCVALCLFRTE